MSYFNLRKHALEAEPEEAEPEEEEAHEEPPAATPQGAAGALWAGISGPGRWLTAHGRPGLAWLLYAGSAWAAGFYGGWVVVGVCAAWLLLVLLFIPGELLERAAEVIERCFSPAPKPVTTAPPGGEREAVLRLLRDLIGDAHGVHLKTVLAHLQKHGQWEGKKVADLRVHLQALGIPVDPKLRVGKVPTRGVSRAALETLPPVEETAPSPTPSPPV